MNQTRSRQIRTVQRKTPGPIPNSTTSLAAKIPSTERTRAVKPKRSALWTSFCFVFFFSLPAAAAEQWYVEFVGAEISRSAVELAVALELREVEIPGDPRRPEDAAKDVSLHIRLEASADAILVSLWDRGELAGKRRVSSGGHPRVMARRVGLAVGELARQLSARRSRLVQELERDTFLAQEQEKEFVRLQRLHDLGLRADFQGLLFASGAHLFGPSVGIEFNDHFPVRFATGLSWMAGGIPALSDGSRGQRNPSWSLFDLWLRMDHAWALREPAWVTAGVDVTVSAVHVGGATEVDQIDFQRDTYTARLGGRVGYAHSFTETVRVRGEISGGSLLRSIPMELGSQRIDLGGGYLGLHLGVTLAPASGE